MQAPCPALQSPACVLVQARRIQRKAQEQSAGTTEVEHPGRQTLGTIAVRRPARGGGLAGPAGLKRKAGAGL